MDMFGQEKDRYISLSNKYRPQTFEDVVGQETISKTLTNAIKLGRVGHAYLFYGPRGCGKTTSARIFAKALNCTGNGNKPAASPCGKCPQCIEIANGSDMDVLELDAASNTQVDKIREAIIDTVALAATRDRFKIFILDEVHMLSDSSFNALLKTIEEPPAHVVFILATTEKHKVPATISSRCQTFRFRPITQEDISAHLTALAQKENINIEPKAVQIIASQAGGALRDALTILDRAIAYSDGSITEELVIDMLGLMPEDILKAAVKAVLKKNYNEMHTVFETIQMEGFDPLSFLRDLKNALGDLFYLSIGHGHEPFSGAAELAKKTSPSYIAGLTRKINKVIDETKFADSPLITAEVGIFTVMDSCIDLDAFIKRLEKLESALSGNSPTEEEKKNLNSFNPSQTKDNNIEITQKPVTAKITVENIGQEAPKKAPKVVHAKIADIPLPAKKSTTAQPENADFQKFKLSFKDNFFIFDALKNCSYEIEGDTWSLSFNKANSFYATALEVKIAELEEKSQELFAKKINFIFSAEMETKPAPAKPASVKEKRIPFAPIEGNAEPTFKSPFKPKTQQSPVKTIEAPAKPVIYNEEPFVKKDFSAEFESVKTDREIPDYVKSFLGIIPGEVIK
ncbi:DNA polymerase III, subunits gamma and tau [Elusimicrobium minutum Pei191]|uniref:DNA polymerase III subunit gamma/tau n=1 Tax=Elusimicrobium minutum (strain Pei191) TaxID=445932 RepID=B2KES0_ELUMP|nr:DNA polymerase III subunit gamma/tau [Elusimicrobium minutum]ACC99016.1 DNA polymerase III, subunits gamma and tau [Elusimicrobium minutum Pei191]